MDLKEEEGINYMSVTEGRYVKKEWPLCLLFRRRFQNTAAVLNDENMKKQSRKLRQNEQCLILYTEHIKRKESGMFLCW